MTTRKILNKFGCTTERLREIFSAVQPTAKELEAMEPEEKERRLNDCKIKDKLTSRIQSRINAGIAESFKTMPLYQAVDMALDTPTITKELLPLQMVAQGKIRVDQCVDMLNKLGCAKDFIKKNGDQIDIDFPKFVEVSVSLVRSYLTRRKASQCARYNNIWPFYKYEPRGTDDEDRLRADVLSQFVDIMADAFGYRDQQEQAIGRLFNYGHDVAFVAESWTKRESYMPKRVNAAFVTEGQDPELEVVSTEGVTFVNPHPSRIYYDNSRPLSSINTVNPPQWVGFWDIIRYEEILDNPDFWNRDSVNIGQNIWELSQMYLALLSYYYDPKVIKLGNATSFSFDMNDRKQSFALYKADMRDYGVYVTNHYERLNPKKEGIADYPFDVWVRLVVAGDSTVIGGEFLCSAPAAYGGYNESDDRLCNISMAHEIIPFQDQCSNILTQLLMDMKIDFMTIALIDTDMLGEEEAEKVSNLIKKPNWWQDPLLIKYSGAKDSNLSIQKDPVRIRRGGSGDIQDRINNAFRAILQLLNIVERLLILSPQELGQNSQREATATEVAQMNASVNSIYEYISDAVDRMRSAQKKIIYESTVGECQKMKPLPAIKRFTRKVIESAGFEIVGEYDTDTQDIPRRYTVLGSPECLMYEINFNSRDGGERSSNQQAANALVGAFSALLKVPNMPQAMGMERIVKIANEIFRLSGAHDLKIESDEELGGTMEERVGRIEQMLQQMAAAAQQQYPQAGGAPALPPEPIPAEQGTEQRLMPEESPEAILAEPQ